MAKKHLSYVLRIILFSIILGLLVSCSFVANSINKLPPFNDSHIDEILLDYAISPDGATLGIYTNAGIYFYDLETMIKTTFVEFDDKEYDFLLKSGAIAFSHDGERIAISGKYKEEPIQIFDSHSNELVLTLSSSLTKDAVTELEYSPTGESIVVRNTYQAMCHGPEDRLFLYNLPRQEIVFEVEKCAIYPPIRFHFTKDKNLFLYLQNMSPEYESYFVDSVTGEIVNPPCQWDENDGFFGSSSQSNIQLLQECFSIETVEKISSIGNPLLFPNINRYVIKNYSSETKDGEYPIELWENEKRVCEFETTRGYPPIKASANEQIFTFGTSYLIERNSYDYQLFVWNIDDCKKIGVLQFDSS